MGIVTRKRKRSEVLTSESSGTEFSHELLENTVLYLLSRGIEALALKNNSYEQCSTAFEGLIKPGIPMFVYLRRIVDLINQWAKQVEAMDGAYCEEQNLSAGITHLFVALVYIERLQLCGKVVLNEKSIHRVVLTSMLLAHKFLEDKRLGNEWFSKVGGVTKKELCELEKSFCQACDWKLLVHVNDFQQIKAKTLKTFTTAISSRPNGKRQRNSLDLKVNSRYQHTFIGSAPSVSAF